MVPKSSFLGAHRAEDPKDSLLLSTHRGATVDM